MEVMCETAHVSSQEVKKLCGKGGGLRPGKGHRVCGETEEPVNLMEIIKGMVVTREAAREEGQIEVGGELC